MTSTIETEQIISVGEEVVVGSASPKTHYSVFFEDDRETGCFYALDESLEENRILDALQIYRVSSVLDRDKPSLLQVLWSEDGLKAALLINDYPHAAFNFSEKRGYCRSNFPPPNEGWTSFGHEWSDAAFRDDFP